MKKPIGAKIFRNLSIVLIVVWSVGPILVGLATSLSTQNELNQMPAPLWPTQINLSAYQALLSPNLESINAPTITSEIKSFGKAMRNSLVAVVGTVAVTLFVCIPAAYALRRLRFRGQNLLFYLIIATIAVPAFTLVAPLFRIISDLKLINTYTGLIVIYLSALGPFSLWLFYNYIGDLPVEVEEAAQVDGANRIRTFLFVVLPEMGSGIAAMVAILTLSVWGQFFLPLLFAPTLVTKPVTVLITEFVGKYNRNIPVIAAAGILAIIPPAIVAVGLNRYIRGMLVGWDK